MTVNIEDNAGNVDTSLNLLLIHSSEFNDMPNLELIDTLFIQLHSNLYYQHNLSDPIQTGQSHSFMHDGDDYDLYLTDLPIISILPVDSIVDEPKRPAGISYFDATFSFNSPIGIEIRGGSSQEFPKKTYDFEIRRNLIDDSTTKVSLGTLRNDDDWILDAVYNEPLRIRSQFSHQLWTDVHTPYYIADKQDAKSGVNTNSVEVFLENKYQGTYNLSEKVDRKLLKLSKFDDDISGELYKSFLWGAPTFWQAIPFDNSDRIWDGYEYKYPKTDEATDWSNIFDFTHFVINSEDDQFAQNIWSQLNEQNAIDYYLFFNLLKATDNTAKNTYFAKYDENEPYFYIPWDLDACFGNTWEGYRDSSAYGEIHNRCFTRLKEINQIGFHQKASIRWSVLRMNQYHKDTLRQKFCDLYNQLKDNGNYEREALVYGNYNFDNEEKDFFEYWLNERLEFLDIYFNYTGIDEYSFQNIQVYPNPFNETITVNLTNDSEMKQYLIHSIEGKLIQKGNIFSNQSIQLNSIPKGVYLLNIENQIIKLIKR
jgi:hypothetical protein